MIYLLEQHTSECLRLWQSVAFKGLQHSRDSVTLNPKTYAAAAQGGFGELEHSGRAKGAYSCAFFIARTCALLSLLQAYSSSCTAREVRSDRGTFLDDKA
jgi:hypothetical protein